MSLTFSRRTSWRRELDPVARRLKELAATGRAPIDLTGTAADLADLAGLCFEPGTAPSELPAADELRAREALSEFLGARGPQVDPGRLVLTGGVRESCAWALKLLCDPGDDVLVPHPCSRQFERLAGLEGLNTREYPLHFDREWHLDVEDLSAVATARTRAVLVASPNAATGAYLKRGELEVLWDLCAARGWALVCDEELADYPGAHPPQSRIARAAIPEARALTLTLGGLPGVGWLVVEGPRPLRDEALARLEALAPCYLPAGVRGQKALPGFLRLVPQVQERLHARLLSNRAQLMALRTAAASWTVLPSEGGSSAVVRIPGHVEEEEVCLRLLEQGVAVQPGSAYDFAAARYLVLSLLAPGELFAEGARRLAGLLDSL